MTRFGPSCEPISFLDIGIIVDCSISLPWWKYPLYMGLLIAAGALIFICSSVCCIYWCCCRRKSDFAEANPNATDRLNRLPWTQKYDALA